MPPLIRHVTIDCADPYELASFWAQVFDTEVDEEDQPGDPEALVDPGHAAALLFIRVPESKAVKNRVHLDMQPQERTRDEEVERLLALGAAIYEDHRNPDGTGWVTMTDPEGNEFCVERSQAERS